MTTTAEPLLPEPLVPGPRPSLYDRWSARLALDPRRQRLLAWLAPTLIVLLAGVLRFWNIGHPDLLVFDETYYVKDAWSQWNLGFPAQWPDDADALFTSGHADAFKTEGSFAVHPPLGKWIIGLGMALFGPDSSVGWRFTTALLGTALVLVVYLIARLLTGSTVFASVAGLLMAIDGLAIVMSRIALLDGILTFFIALTFLFVILDRRRHLERLAAVLEARGPVDWGPVLWNRPWLLAAGAAAGAATAVKWSGLYVIAAVGIYIVVTDALARRRAGVGYWPADAVFRQGLASFVVFVPIAFVVYLASWTGWLVTDGGYARHMVDGSPATGFWSWVPLPLQNLWFYHQEMYRFHVGLDTPHPYASPAWQWPLLVRPTSMYFHLDPFGQSGCEAANGCSQNVYSMPNPLIWWGGAIAVVYLVYRFVVARDWRHGLVLTAVAATYVPWLLYPDRTIFQFYTIAILPFTVLALTFAIRDLANPRTDDPIRRKNGQRLAIVLLAFMVALSVFWYPVLTAVRVPYDFFRSHSWFQTWV